MLFRSVRGKILAELNEIFPEREVVLARELTKKFEEFLRGTPAALLEIAQKRSLKGEFVVLVGGAPGVKPSDQSRPAIRDGGGVQTSAGSAPASRG